MRTYHFMSDSHTHSDCSFDGKDSVSLLCRQGAGRGLYSLTITDHCECHEYAQQGVGEAIRRSLACTAKAKVLYRDQLKVYAGIELGQPTQDEAAALEALSLGEYDFVLGSLHNLRGEQDFYFLDYTPETASTLLERYWEELLEVAEQNLFDSLAHLDYPLRYIVGNAGIRIAPETCLDAVDRILKVLVQNDKALEINTSGLRQVIGRTLPGEEILRRFRALGGKYVTLGSDAHRWGDIGAGIEQGLELLLSCGFTHFTIFEGRTPVLLPIE